jgi:hypothetical protein
VPYATWMVPPDAERLPGTGEGPEELWARSLPLAGSAAEAYLARRRVPLAVAERAGVRVTAELNGRPAVLARLLGPRGETRAVHGRHLHNRRGESKMFTVGCAGGLFAVPGALTAEPLVLVEGLFDALSLAGAGIPCAATIGRWIDWLPALARGRTVWLAFDANRPGESSARSFAALLGDARCRRLRPPGRQGDWNAALRKRGGAALARWLLADAADSLEWIS